MHINEFLWHIGYANFLKPPRLFLNFLEFSWFFVAYFWEFFSAKFDSEKIWNADIYAYSRRNRALDFAWTGNPHRGRYYQSRDDWFDADECFDARIDYHYSNTFVRFAWMGNWEKISMAKIKFPFGNFLVQNFSDAFRNIHNICKNVNLVAVVVEWIHNINLSA